MHVLPPTTLLFQLTLCFLLISFYGLSSQQDPSTICPPEDVIEPCTCTKSCPVCDALVKCSNILNNDELVRVFNKSSDYVFWNFYIENSTFLYIPSDTLVLKRTRFLYLKNNVMVSLFDKPPPPTNVLKELELTNLILRTGVRWNIFSSLINLKELNMTNFIIKKIDKAFLNNFPQGLTGLFLYNTETKTLGDDAFSKFTKMTRILVRNTRINVLKRSMFSPSPKLVSITFTGNQISSLPDDMFTDMPLLRSIDFSDTLLTVLQESVFRSILPQIGLLYMKGNAIDCNCQMKWITSMNAFPYYLETVCQEPKRLQGVSIDKLTPSDFNHCE